MVTDSDGGGGGRVHGEGGVHNNAENEEGLYFIPRANTAGGVLRAADSASADAWRSEIVVTRLVSLDVPLAR